MRKFGPLPSDDLPTKSCAACDNPFRAGDYTTLVPLGPGDDEKARKRCREGQPYTAVCAHIHWDCADWNRLEE